MTEPATAPAVAPAIRIDIVSDIVCPWCLIGWRQLEQALEQRALTVTPHWHPFELNPDMPAEGQDLHQHLMAKYSMTRAQSEAGRQRLSAIGAELGQSFAWGETMRSWNSFQAHQLLDWAETQGPGHQHVLKLALFAAYFERAAAISDRAVLLDAVETAGLSRADAAEILDSGIHAGSVRTKQRFWIERGVQGVPAMVFSGRYAAIGAQGVEAYGQILDRLSAEAATAVSTTP